MIQKQNLINRICYWWIITLLSSLVVSCAEEEVVIENEGDSLEFLVTEEEQVWGHDGGEQGVATVVAFNKETKVGAIVLSKQREADLADILSDSYQMGVLIK